MLTSTDRIQAIQGYAGVGKSEALLAIREGAQSAGYAVEGFAPTSRAAEQLREAGISATTLQGFLARGGIEQSAGDPSSRHLYLLDESSLASTRQVRDFLNKIGAQDRVLLVGDIRQHQAVDAGKPFEQLQQAGMQTAQLDQIVRQKDPALLRAVEHLARADVAAGIEMLREQGRVVEIPDRAQRIEAIAKEFARNPERTLVVSPDNASRREINEAAHGELQRRGVVARDDHAVKVLVPRSELTGADRAWASRYEVGDVLRYHRGSSELGLRAGSYAQVVSTNPRENEITVRKPDGSEVAYDPARLRGIDAYTEVERRFSVGDRIQFTAPQQELHVANRALGTIEQIAPDGSMTARMDSGKAVSFDPAADAPLRSWLRRHQPQRAGSHRRPRSRPRGPRSAPGPCQQPIRVCLGVARELRGKNLHRRRHPAARAPEHRDRQDRGARFFAGRREDAPRSVATVWHSVGFVNEGSDCRAQRSSPAGIR